MYKLKYTVLFISIISLSCSNVSKEKIVENANNSLTIYNIDTKDKFYPSHIHRDKDRSSLFWEKPDGTILKISDRKQEISALLFECILFKAMSGFVSRVDQTRVYNSYKYNIKTTQLIKTTNNPFFYGG